MPYQNITISANLFSVLRGEKMLTIKIHICACHQKLIKVENILSSVTHIKGYLIKSPFQRKLINVDQLSALDSGLWQKSGLSYLPFFNRVVCPLMNELSVHYIGFFFVLYIYRLSVIFEARKNILIHVRSGGQKMQEQQQVI